VSAVEEVEAPEDYRLNGEWIEQLVDGQWVAQVKTAAAIRITKEAVRQTFEAAVEAPPEVGDLRHFRLDLPVEPGWLLANGDLHEIEYLPEAFVKVMRERIDGYYVRLPSLVEEHSTHGVFVWTGDTDVVAYEDAKGSGCKAFSCGERDPGTGGEWWLHYGTCSRLCAVDYYGEEAIG